MEAEGVKISENVKEKKSVKNSNLKFFNDTFYHLIFHSFPAIFVPFYWIISEAQWVRSIVQSFSDDLFENFCLEKNHFIDNSFEL